MTERKTRTETASKSFQNSQEVRDAVYEEWRARKSEVLKASQRQLQEEQLKRDAALKNKAVSQPDCISTFTHSLTL